MAAPALSGATLQTSLASSSMTRTKLFAKSFLPAANTRRRTVTAALLWAECFRRNLKSWLRMTHLPIQQLKTHSWIQLLAATSSLQNKWALLPNSLKTTFTQSKKVLISCLKSIKVCMSLFWQLQLICTKKKQRLTAKLETCTTLRLRL